jgi:Putative glycoside hydrolase Family 18, chitinase_18
MKLKVLLAVASPLVLTMIFSTSCQKALTDSSTTTTSPAQAAVQSPVTYLSNLVAYKASTHPLMMGYYRTWGDRSITGDSSNPRMTDMPDSVDILSVFPGNHASGPFFTALSNTYMATLHSKGTKVIWTPVNNPWPHATSGSDTANIALDTRKIMDTINLFGYDGFDCDYEGQYSSAIVIAGMKYLSKYLGPKSGTGKLLTLATNISGIAPSNVPGALAPDVNYVLFEDYSPQFANGKYYGDTSSNTSVAYTLKYYTSYILKSQFLVGSDFESAAGAETMPNYTTWTINNKTGGEFSYGIDAEYAANHNALTRASIQAMNPAKN